MHKNAGIPLSSGPLGIRTHRYLGAGGDVWYGVASKKELCHLGHLGVGAVAGPKVHALKSSV